MSKLTTKQRSELIARIMEDISYNIAQYEDFVLDCVKDRIENWEDKELLNWIGQ